MSSFAPSQVEHFPVRKRAASLIALVAFLCAAACNLEAQRLDIPLVRSDNFAISQSKLRLSIRQMRNDVDYVIGIQVDSRLHNSGSIEVGDFVTSASGRFKSRQFQGLTTIGREKVEFGTNSVTISGLDEFRGDALLLLTVPTATKVVISVNGSVEFAGIPLKGAIIHHGQLVATEFLGRHQLFSRLLFPDLDAPQLEMARTQGGYLWSQEALNKHLISFNRPSNHPDSILGEVETVTVALKIDTNGNVVLAKPLNGREPFVTESVNAISQARFSPFIVNGSAVDALGDVTVVFAKSGRVSSTLKH